MASVAEKMEVLHQKLEHIQKWWRKQIERQHSRGKLTARERLNLLFDESSLSKLVHCVSIIAIILGRTKTFRQMELLPDMVLLMGVLYLLLHKILQ